MAMGGLVNFVRLLCMVGQLYVDKMLTDSFHWGIILDLLNLTLVLLRNNEF